MQYDSPPDALLLLHATCPHCPALFAALSQLVEEGVVGRLEVVNIAVHPAVAQELGVRGVPWCRIGTFELEGDYTPAELRNWAEQAVNPEGMSAYFEHLLQHRHLAKVERIIAQQPDTLRHLLPLVGDPDTPLHSRLGAGAVFEQHAGTEALRALLPQLGELSRHADHRVRTDVCHYLGLSHDRAAVAWLAPCLQDPHSDVRATASDSLAELEPTRNAR